MERVMTTGGKDMGEAECKSGRAAVRLHLLEPLAGLVRRRGVSAVDHDRMLARLVERLAYMDAAHLAGLAEVILRHASGGGVKVLPVWPEVGVVLAWAIALQVPPPHESDYARSLMRSAMGQQARDEGWMVELYQIAKRIGPPPGKYIIAKLRDAASEARRRRERVRDRIDAGSATPEEAHWLAAWHADQAEAGALVLAGCQARTQGDAA